jgi:hypothetical protein
VVLTATPRPTASEIVETNGAAPRLPHDLRMDGGQVYEGSKPPVVMSARHWPHFLLASSRSILMLHVAPELQVSGTVQHNAAVLGLTANWLFRAHPVSHCLANGTRWPSLFRIRNPRAPVYEVTLLFRMHRSPWQRTGGGGDVRGVPCGLPSVEKGGSAHCSPP